MKCHDIEENLIVVTQVFRRNRNDLCTPKLSLLSFIRFPFAEMFGLTAAVSLFVVVTHCRQQYTIRVGAAAHGPRLDPRRYNNIIIVIILVLDRVYYTRTRQCLPAAVAAATHVHGALHVRVHAHVHLVMKYTW